ncbi:hypothetical protein [Lewinella sp. LCG006]|uniref:hypothetical protein n=1 Tax=Lewinella sp. LCG006 TaxID=3231911 RepID=UPI00345F6557
MNHLKKSLRILKGGTVQAMGWMVLLWMMLAACQENPPKEGSTEEEQSADSIREITAKSTNSDSLKIDEAAVPYVSLLAQRDQIVSDAMVAALIEEGAKKIVYTNNSSVLSSLHPVPPIAYDKVSFFAYLEDLLRLTHYEAHASEVQMNDPKKVTWPRYSGLPEPDHEALAYPLVRRDYLSEYCPGCLNPGYSSLKGKEVDPAQVSHPRYQPLLALYTQIFDPQLRHALYKDYMAFAYEEWSVKTNNTNTQSSATAALASQFNQRARAEVNSEKAQQASRMQQYFTHLKQARKGKDDRAMEKYLNEILKLQEELLEPLPIQDDIRRFFADESKSNPFPTAIKAKAEQLNSYHLVEASSDERILSGPAMSFAQKALQATPLNSEELAKIRTTLNDALKRVATFTSEKEDINDQLAAHNAVFTEEERAFFNAYLLSFDYHTNVWKRFALQLQELLEVPQEESSFSYLLLLDHAIKERDKALANNPLISTAHNKLRKLAGMYYREVRDKEVVFK